jgi:O-antigen ligase
MSRKKRREPLKPAATGLSSGGPSGNGPVVAVLALMMVLAPGLGVPHELMLQDTFKSIVVSFAALGAGLLFCWHHRQRPENLHWHAILWLPLALMAYALGSMAWSHAYLAGVEAVRWFILSLLLWLGLNSFTRERLPLLAWGIHTGAVIASFWTALQFWFDFSLFTQGPNPASTFVNRNFFAEFAVCTLPLSALLLATARTPAWILALALSTRSALLALVVMLVVLPVALYRCRDQLACLHWPPSRHAVLLALLIGTVAGLGSIPTGNPGLIREHILNQRGDTALTRAWVRGQSAMETQEYTQRSFAMRLVMWKATARMIAARPLTGVGAGAWEVDVPLYQADGSQLETDYYAHNEILQLLAEYGLAGWLFLLGLLAYLARAAW